MRKYFKKLFKRYNQRMISEDKRKIIDEWYDIQVKSTSGVPNEEKVEKEIWLNLKREINREKMKPFILRGAWKWVAALLICSLGATLYYYQSKNTFSLIHTDMRPATHQAFVTSREGDGELEVFDQQNLDTYAQSHKGGDIILSTPKGTSFDLLLPDGTKVFLNSDSKLSYPKEFSDTVRKVKLQGEAYFEVAHNHSKAFIVQTDDVDIKVLGTKFNVRAYPESEDNAVSLLEGSVKLLGSQAETLLQPGELARIEKDLFTFDKVTFGDNDPIAWKKGYFNFNDTPISKIVKDLSRWYDVEFDLSEIKQDIRFTGRIPKKINLDSVLNYLSSTQEIQFIMDIDKIKITNQITK